MLTIRNAQMRALADASLPNQIEAMMRQHFPLNCAALGPDGTTQTVRDGMKRGRALHFEDAQLAAYVALEFAFDTSFSTNLELSWAQDILNDFTQRSVPRMEELRSRALLYLAKLAEVEAINLTQVHG